MTPTCPLCQSLNAILLYKSSKSLGDREFYLCEECDLVHVPSCFHLSSNAEKARYLEHNNDVEDAGYRRFLGKLWTILQPQLTKGASGIDFGSGPGPALVKMITEDGFDIVGYDPYFNPNASFKESSYDFITCTETVEHFSSPYKEFKLFRSILKPTGILGVMTGMLQDWSEFPNWYYNRDPTHIAYYSSQTMCWIAANNGMTVTFPAPNVSLFRKIPLL